ncbi:MAG: protein-glutamate O-methyltransferase [Gammaproteobacteria bacterium]|nr:protein-glutamate O-methyltransferase [Gammaproteobacteria bacterium]
MTDKDFERIRGWIREETGIKISDAKRQMVYARLTKRLRALGYTQFKDYLDYLESDERDNELVNFKNAITTNLTSFFREPHHFDFLEKQAFAEIRARALKGAREIRIWSAGCSTGQEAYSIAATIDKCFPKRVGWDIRILATDIDTNVLQEAKQAIYPVEKLKDLDDVQRENIFETVQGDTSVLRVKSHLRQMVVFNQLNLMAPEWPIKRMFDLIFCRNVMIYFDKPTQHQLVSRYWSLLKENGYLLLGHSESLFGLNTRYRLVGKNIYQKIED